MVLKCYNYHDMKKILFLVFSNYLKQLIYNSSINKYRKGDQYEFFTEIR